MSFVALLLALLASSCSAFTVPLRAGGAPACSTVRMSGVINDAIDKENPKVVTMVKTSEVDKKAVMCRCWKSGTFPACDAAHVAHNKETGDNVGPLIIDNDGDK